MLELPQPKWGAKVYENGAKLFFINDFVHRPSMRVSGRSGSLPQDRPSSARSEEAATQEQTPQPDALRAGTRQLQRSTRRRPPRTFT